MAVALACLGIQVVIGIEEGRLGIHERQRRALEVQTLRAPSIANLITSFFRACPGEPCPWEFV